MKLLGNMAPPGIGSSQCRATPPLQSKGKGMSFQSLAPPFMALPYWGSQVPVKERPEQGR